MDVDNSAFVARMALALMEQSATVRQGRRGAGTHFSIHRIDAGKLWLPTGRICVTDAYSADAYPPLNRIVPPGEYPVELVIAQFAKDARCAFLVVTFSDTSAASWEPITAVESATPCFMDEAPNVFIQEGATGVFSPEAAAVHFEQLHQDFDGRSESIRKQSKRFGSQDWINFRPGEDATNMIICEGGMGDGQFECFVGLTAVGRVARLVVDFGIADPAAAILHD